MLPATCTPRPPRLCGRNLQTARQQLDRLASAHPEQAAQAQVVAGLYAHEAGDAALAGDLLTAAPGPGGSSKTGGSTCSPRTPPRRGDAGSAARRTRPPDRRLPGFAAAAGRLPGDGRARRRPPAAGSPSACHPAHRAKVDGNWARSSIGWPGSIGRQLEDARGAARGRPPAPDRGPALLRRRAGGAHLPRSGRRPRLGPSALRRTTCCAAPSRSSTATARRRRPRPWKSCRTRSGLRVEPAQGPRPHPGRPRPRGLRPPGPPPARGPAASRAPSTGSGCWPWRRRATASPPRSP